ncbi:MAG TPA: class I SAM-dependent methyltransferase [Candidatus Acidoferrales bacterium]|nr:class I SAM-dependent methyltransferase [Candidatus Acidoferrales bacterium]
MDCTARSLQCQFCGSQLRHTFADLGMSPLSNSYLHIEQLNQMEPFYPLHARVCSQCFLVQLEQFEKPEAIFGDYAYFSSYSSSWLDHARTYAHRVIERFSLSAESLVMEVASNDGYLLQYFHEKGIPVLGIEPARNVAEAALKKGIRTISKFFGLETARELQTRGQQADLIAANNVLAHVPDIKDFVSGLKLALKPRGIITAEFPHLFRLIEANQFDTIYHEHFSYFSLLTIQEIFANGGLKIFDVEELTTHGGSLRIYACHEDAASPRAGSGVSLLRDLEVAAGLRDLKTYSSFDESVRETKRSLLNLLIRLKREGKSVVGYGAPAKGNTLLNHCGIGKDFLDYTVDISPHKQNLFLPGTHIPIFAPEQIRITQPDYVLILPWNLRDEITEQLAYIREWGGRFIIPIPNPEVLE